MHLVTDPQHPLSVVCANIAEVSAVKKSVDLDRRIKRRKGAAVNSGSGRISVAMSKAFLAIECGQSAVSARILEVVARFADGVDVLRRVPPGPASVTTHQGARRCN